MNDDPVDLLQEWFEWWQKDPDAPAKMPDALHVRTAIFLKINEMSAPDVS